MPLYLKLNTRGLRLVLSTLLQSTNQSNYNEEDDKKAQKINRTNVISTVQALGCGDIYFLEGEGGLQGLGLVLHLI